MRVSFDRICIVRHLLANLFIKLNFFIFPIANVAHFDEENGKPLCDQCCLQKKKGSYCPLCEGCYDDNDYEARMMECATCGGWIHAKCEGVDAEKYQILSHLPNTIDYVCK